MNGFWLFFAGIAILVILCKGMDCKGSPAEVVQESIRPFNGGQYLAIIIVAVVVLAILVLGVNWIDNPQDPTGFVFLR